MGYLPRQPASVYDRLVDLNSGASVFKDENQTCLSKLVVETYNIVNEELDRVEYVPTYLEEETEEV